MSGIRLSSILQPIIASGRAAWRLIAAGCLIAVGLNAITTSDPLPFALSKGLWRIGGVDLALLASAAIAAGVGGRKLCQKGKSHTLIANRQG